MRTLGYASLVAIGVNLHALMTHVVSGDPDMIVLSSVGCVCGVIGATLLVGRAA